MFFLALLSIFFENTILPMIEPGPPNSIPRNAKIIGEKL